MRAVIYARVSSDPTKESRSVDGQIDECRRFVDRQGWTLAREPFADNDRSASRHSKKDRPEYTHLIEYLDGGGADALVLWSGSRAQRDMRDYLRLRDVCAERQVLYVINGRIYNLERTDDRFQTGLDALMAEREADTIRDNVRRGMRLSAQAGRPAGRLLFGFVRQYDERGAYIGQIEHPEQAPIIREVFREVDAGAGLSTIAKSLNDRGIGTPTGGEWDGTTVRRIVTNPHYCGRRVFQGMVIGDGDWQPLVDVDLWERANAIVTDPNRRTQRGTALKWQLSGAARCGVCPPDDKGKPVRLRAIVTRRGRPAYGCTRCGKTTVRADWLDQFVDTLVVGRLRRPDAALVFTPASNSAAVAEAREEVKALSKRLAEHYAAASVGELSAAGLGAVEKMLLPQIREAEANVRRLSLPPVLRNVNPAELADRWLDTPVKLRRDVILAVADIVLDPRTEYTNTFDRWRLARSRWVGDPMSWGQHWKTI